MSEAPTPARPAAFSPRVMLAVLLTGVISFSAFSVLSVYAPDLRAGDDGGAHALSKSAVGFAGAVAILKARGAPVVISRAPARPGGHPHSTLVLTPGVGTSAQDLAAYGWRQPTLIVLPKWTVIPDQLRTGWVRKYGVASDGGVKGALGPLARRTEVHRRKGVSTPKLHGGGAGFAEGTYLPLAAIDRLQTISGEGWEPALVDETGAIVLARSAKAPDVYVLADPDILNTQGLGKLDNARAGLAIVDMIRDRREGVVFDVALAGFERPRSVLRLMFEPPLAGATLCAVAAALLLGAHALARFGPASREDRAFALGKRALVDNSAGLVRLARKEHQLAPAYARLTADLAARAAGVAGEDPGARLALLARLRRPRESFDDLGAAAARAHTRGDLLAVARKLYDWRLEMTRERR